MVDAMKFILCLVALCACAGPNHVRATPVPPPRYERPAGHSSRPTTPLPEMSDEAADEFLKQDIERKTAMEERPVPITERVVYVQRPADHYVREYRRERRHYRSRFPWNTAAGAGLGAVLGHQSGHRDRGALIGASFGLLMDLAR